MKSLICLLLCLPLLLGAEVYKHITEDGRVIYSDRPDGQTQPLNLPPLPSVQPPPAPSRPAPQAPTRTRPREAPGLVISILKPHEDEALRSNEGEVEIVLRVSPGALRPSTHIRLELDQRLLPQSYHEPRIRLHQVERGTHQLRALLLDEHAVVVAQSAVVSFHLQRYAIHP